MSLESGHHEVMVFGSESTLLSPVKLLRGMIRDFIAAWELGVMLAFRDLKAQYRQSFLGSLWLIIPPLAWTIGITVARENNLTNIGDLSDSPEKSTAYLLISMAMWQMFTQAVRGPLGAFQMNRGILTKVRFPREAIVIADLVKQSVAMAILCALIVAAFVYFRLPVPGSIVFFPLALLILVALGTVIGLILAPVGLLYKDVGNSMQYLLLAGLAVTPVTFTMEGLAPGGLFRTGVFLNPVTHVLVTARELAMGETLTLLPQFSIVTILTIVFSVVGLTILRASMPLVVERWSS